MKLVVDPQPSYGDVLTIKRYYSSSKLSVDYKRRVTIFENGPPCVRNGLNKITLVGYLGICSPRAASVPPTPILPVDDSTSSNNTLPRTSQFEPKNCSTPKPRLKTPIQGSGNLRGDFLSIEDIVTLWKQPATLKHSTGSEGIFF